MIKKIALLFTALMFASVASADLRKYGQATTIYFPLVELAGVNYTASAICVTGDVKIIKDGGTAANTSACFAHEGEGIYSLAISSTELQAAEAVVIIKDQTNPKIWLDNSINVSTYGDSLAQHAMDLDSEAFLNSQRTLYRGTVETEDFGPTITQFEADLVNPFGASADLSSIAVPDGANRLNARVVVFISGGLAGSATTIADFVMANGRGMFTVSGLTEVPADGDLFVIF